MRNAECGMRNVECGTRNGECGMRVRLGRRIAAVVVVIAAAVAWRAGRAIEVAAAEPFWDTGTFLILGFDPAKGGIGGAVQSRGFFLGKRGVVGGAGPRGAATPALLGGGGGARWVA